MTRANVFPGCSIFGRGPIGPLLPGPFGIPAGEPDGNPLTVPASGSFPAAPCTVPAAPDSSFLCSICSTLSFAISVVSLLVKITASRCLRLIYLTVNLILLKQLFMRSKACDAPLVHDNDAVGILYA